MAGIMFAPKFHVDDDTGAPLSGGLVYTYDAGTTTPKNTYADSGAVTPNANPTVLDSRGEATMYGTGTYKVVVKTSGGTTVYTVDNYRISGTVGTADIDDGAVTTAKLATNALSADTTGRSKMQDGFVTSAKLATAGVALPDGSTAPTQSDGDNSTKVANTAYCDTRVSTATKVVARAYTEYATYARITTAAYLDDTVPLDTEGDDVMTITRSAASATNRYRHTVTLVGTVSATAVVVMSIWQGSTCVYATAMSGVGGYEDRGARTAVFEHVPGTTSSTTWTIQVGVFNPGYFDINGYSGARTFGGVNKCTYVIEELQP